MNIIVIIIIMIIITSIIIIVIIINIVIIISSGSIIMYFVLSETFLCRIINFQCCNFKKLLSRKEICSIISNCTQVSFYPHTRSVRITKDHNEHPNLLLNYKQWYLNYVQSDLWPPYCFNVTQR